MLLHSNIINSRYIYMLKMLFTKIIPTIPTMTVAYCNKRGKRNARREGIVINITNKRKACPLIILSNFGPKVYLTGSIVGQLVAPLAG